MVVKDRWLSKPKYNDVVGQRNQQHQRDAGPGHQLHQERERVPAGGAQRDQDRGAQEAPDADPRTGRQASDQVSYTRHVSRIDNVWNGQYNFLNNDTMAFYLLKVATINNNANLNL